MKNVKPVSFAVPKSAHWYVSRTLSEEEANQYWALNYHILRGQSLARSRRQIMVVGPIALLTALAITSNTAWLIAVGALWLIASHVTMKTWYAHREAMNAIYDPSPEKWDAVATVVFPMWERAKNIVDTVKVHITLPE